MATAASQRLTAMLGAVDPSARRHIETPEGVLLPVDLASRGERAAAFMIDLFAIVASFVVILLTMMGVGIAGADLGAWYQILLILIFFFLRSFYFTAFELVWRGTTPGKRVFGLKVIDRGGGALRADAVFARNLMREIEVFIPAMILMIGPMIGSDSPWGIWLYLTVLGWMGVLTLLPLFNKDRLRAGDLIAGTWVILAPKAVLLPDVAQAAVAGPENAAAPEAAGGIRFTRQQLSVYGVEELQTLEHILRQDGPHAAQVRDEVARRIQRKINWEPPAAAVEPRAFLQAFYAAQRRHLEARLLFGKRRKNKFDQT
ncbi:MAG TPA: RDD family protein [Dongiaceae bacterium]